MFEKFKPLGDRVLVKRVQAEEKTESGIFIPDSVKEKAQTGTVVAVGPGGRDTAGNTIAMALKVGDMVYFGKFVGTEADKDFLIIQENEILGTIEK